LQHGQLGNGVISQLRTEARIDKLDKLRPSGAAAVELHAVEPKLGVIEQVECRECHLLVVQSLAHMEEPLAAIQPRQGVVDAVERWELQLVSRSVVVVAGVPCIYVPDALPGARWRSVLTLRALRSLEVIYCIT
jgi:hypothetical protein